MFVSVGVLIFLLCLFFFVAFKENRNRVWAKFKRHYKTKFIFDLTPDFSGFLFCDSGDGFKIIFNQMNFFVLEDGMYIAPPLLKIWISPIFFRWSDVEKIEMLHKGVASQYLGVKLKNVDVRIRINEKLLEKLNNKKGVDSLFGD